MSVDSVNPVVSWLPAQLQRAVPPGVGHDQPAGTGDGGGPTGVVEGRQRAGVADQLGAVDQTGGGGIDHAVARARQQHHDVLGPHDRHGSSTGTSSTGRTASPTRSSVTAVSSITGTALTLIAGSP